MQRVVLVSSMLTDPANRYVVLCVVTTAAAAAAVWCRRQLSNSPAVKSCQALTVTCRKLLSLPCALIMHCLSHWRTVHTVMLSLVFLSYPLYPPPTGFVRRPRPALSLMIPPSPHLRCLLLVRSVSRSLSHSHSLTHLHTHRFHPVRVLLNNIRWSLMDNKFAGEQKLKQSGLPFTIIRPGGLANGPAGTTQLAAGNVLKQQEQAIAATWLGYVQLYSSGCQIARAM